MGYAGQFCRTVIIAAAAMSALVAQPVQAGNLSDPIVTPTVEAPRVIQAQPDWSGPYIGATLGYSFGGDDRVGISVSGVPQGNIGFLGLHGGSGSLRAGYRWQLDHWVFGPELAVEAGRVEDSFSGGGYTGSTVLNRALALRFKAGVSVPRYNSLVYGTLGLTRGNFDYDATGTGSSGTVNFDNSFTTNGYILGVGVEHPLSSRLSVTGEYEYVNYGREALNDGLGNTTIATPLFHNVKLGINLRF